MTERLNVHLYACKICSTVKAHPHEKPKKMPCGSCGLFTEFVEIKVSANPLDLNEFWFYYES
jgi:hypothetical protein